MMRSVWIVAALLLVSALPASAQGVPEDVMEVQRCVWRCNEATSGRQPAYDQCIARSCDVAEKPKSRRQTKKSKRRD